MKKIILGITLACASLAAQAQAKPAFDNYMNFVGGVGFTYGGDKLATGTMDKNNLMAGKGLLFVAGLDFRLTETFSLQSTIGAHIDAVSTYYSGDATFRRTPIELLAYYHPAKRWRLGGGLRYVLSPKVEFDSASSRDREFKNAVGVVLEGEFLLSDHVGFKLRLGSEQFKNKNTVPAGSYYYYGNEKVKGEQIGFITNFYF
jgi:hypothetical protein